MNAKLKDILPLMYNGTEILVTVNLPDGRVTVSTTVSDDMSILDQYRNHTVIGIGKYNHYIEISLICGDVFGC